MNNYRIKFPLKMLAISSFLAFNEIIRYGSHSYFFFYINRKKRTDGSHVKVIIYHWSEWRKNANANSVQRTPRSKCVKKQKKNGVSGKN